MTLLRRTVCLLLVALAFAGCGKSNLRTAVIVEPAHAIYDRLGCDVQPHADRCSFDLRRLLGYPLRDAERVAKLNGLHLNVIGRDQTGLALDETESDPSRVDVATESGIVTEIRGIG